MSITIKTNSGNGSIVDGSLMSFSYSEEVSSLDPTELSGGTGDVSFSAASVENAMSVDAVQNSILMINNDVTMGVNDLGDLRFTVKGTSVSGGVVSANGPTTQSKMNVIKKAEPFTGLLSDAISYYCNLTGVTPVFDGSLALHLNDTVNFLGWEDSVWNKLKELIAVRRAFDPVRVVTSGPVRHDGYYPFEMYVDSATNVIHFREAIKNTVDLTDVAMDKSLSASMFDASKSVDVNGYNTSLKPSPPRAVIYDVKNYAEDIDPADAFNSSIDLSGTTVNANETAEKLFNMDTHMFDVAQPVCVSSITRIPYRPATGNATSWQMRYVLIPDEYPYYFYLAYVKVYVEDTGNQTIPAIGEVVDGAGFSAHGGYPTYPPIGALNGYWTVTNSSEEGNWYEVGPISYNLFPYTVNSGFLDPGTTYDTPFATGEYVIVGDGDIPIQPAEWYAQGGSLTVSKTDNFGELKVTIVAPKTDSLPSADDPNTYVNGPFQVGVESSGDAEYPACWLLGSGISFDKKSKNFLTSAEPSLTTKDSSLNVDNIFITDTFTQNNSGLLAAQSSCGPNVSISGSSSDPLAFGSMLGRVVTESGNKFRINSVSHDGFSASITGVPYLDIRSFNTAMSGKTFANFNAKIPALQFNEFTVLPLIGA